MPVAPLSVRNLVATVVTVHAGCPRPMRMLHVAEQHVYLALVALGQTHVSTIVAARIRHQSTRIFTTMSLNSSSQLRAP